MSKPVQQKVQVWIFTPQKSCLLLKTTTERGAFWQPVTGGVEQGETSLAAAAREAKEETGFQFSAPPQSCDYEFEFDSRWGGRAHEQVYSLLIEAEKNPRLDPKEHQDFKWIQTTVAPQHLTFKGFIDGLHAASKKAFATVVLFMAITVPAAHAAQDARAVKDGVVIRKTPTEEASVLETKKKEDTIRVSANSRDGWFKARTSTGAFGWVRSEDITTELTKASYNYGNLDLQERNEHVRSNGSWHRFHFKAGGGLISMMPGDINRTLGRPAWKAHRGSGFFGTLGFAIDSNIMLGLRLERLSARTHILSYEVESTAMPLLLGAEYNAFRSTSWRIALGLYAGLGLNHEVVVTAVDQENPNRAILSGSTTEALAHISATYSLMKNLGVFAELGGRYSSTLTYKSISNEFNGQATYFMKDDGTKVQFRLSDAGPYLYIGLHLEL